MYQRFDINCLRSRLVDLPILALVFYVVPLNRAVILSGGLVILAGGFSVVSLVCSSNGWKASIILLVPIVYRLITSSTSIVQSVHCFH